MWIAGGKDSSDDSLADVWYSTDGNTWTEVGAGTKFTVRNSHTLIVYNDKMYIHGGTDGGNIMNDAW